MFPPGTRPDGTRSHTAHTRTIRAVEIEGEPWFLARDMCEALGLHASPSNGSYQNHYKHLAADELEFALIPQPNGRNMRMKAVSESGLYKLVMRSKKPEAPEFQHWATAVVLPAIRKDGGYITGDPGGCRKTQGRPPAGGRRVDVRACSSIPPRPVLGVPEASLGGLKRSPRLPESRLLFPAYGTSRGRRRRSGP